MIRNKQKANTIEQQLKEFEARLRRQMLREKLESDERVRNSFDGGAMPQIHVSLGQLASSTPRETAGVQGD